MRRKFLYINFAYIDINLEGRKTMSKEEITKRLDIIIKLLAMNLMQGKETQKDKIIQLSKLGLQPKEIANILGTTSNTVRVTLSAARKEGLL